jgi:predicted MFS family arabinose efflux permease
LIRHVGGRPAADGGESGERSAEVPRNPPSRRTAASAAPAAQGVVALVCMFVLAGARLPKPVVGGAPVHAGRPLMEIAAQPKFIAAAFSGIVSYALMNLLMTSAPLAMKMCGLSLTDANWGIQWHVIAMFLPSFWTGTLIQKFGAARIVTIGLVLTIAAALINLHGLSVAHFWSGLVLLGVGWNFGFIGASSLVVETHRPEERNRVQSFNDFLVFGSMAVGSFASGKLLADFGWDAVNMVIFPLVSAALVVLLLVARKPDRRAANFAHSSSDGISPGSQSTDAISIPAACPR